MMTASLVYGHCQAELRLSLLSLSSNSRGLKRRFSKQPFFRVISC